MRFISYIAVLESQGYREGQEKRFPPKNSIWFDARDPRPDWMHMRQTETA